MIRISSAGAIAPPPPDALVWGSELTGSPGLPGLPRGCYGCSFSVAASIRKFAQNTSEVSRAEPVSQKEI